jgi:hypothetical protein
VYNRPGRSSARKRAVECFKKKPHDKPREIR